jgi:3-isopropylmalate/(R)-2-methylmalate dehydratase small subunit
VIISGLAYGVGDFVDTDVMSPGRFEPYEGPDQLAEIALCDYPAEIPFVDPATKRSPYKVVVAGLEFGCGSSRETAPQALHYAGARVVIARSFGNIFFRNCVNMGLLVPVVIDHGFDESVTGEHISVDLETRVVTCGGQEMPFADLGALQGIVDCGGLTPYTLDRVRAGRAKRVRQPA